MVKPLPPRRPHADAASVGSKTSDRTGREIKRWNETPATLTRQTEARIAEGGPKGKAEGEWLQKPQTSQKTNGKRPFFLFCPEIRQSVVGFGAFSLRLSRNGARIPRYFAFRTERRWVIDDLKEPTQSSRAATTLADEILH